MKICLDTSAYSNFKAGEPQTVTIITKASTVYVPVIVIGELRAGFKLGTRTQKNEDELRKFLIMPAVRVQEVNEEVANSYAEIFLELRRNGTPISTNDIWIAACALQEGATVLTFDSHFDLIRRVGTRLLQHQP